MEGSTEVVFLQAQHYLGCWGIRLKLLMFPWGLVAAAQDKQESKYQVENLETACFVVTNLRPWPFELLN